MNSTMRMKTTNACSGCRILCMVCTEKCILKPCLQWIPSQDAQANATIFLVRFYGLAGLFRLLQAGLEQLQPEIFRSLLFEACGRVVDPVGGSVALWEANKWDQCNTAVEAIFKGDRSSINQVQQVGDLSTSDSSLAAALSHVRSEFMFHPLDVRHVPGNTIINKDKFKRYGNPSSTLRFFHGASPTRSLILLQSYVETSRSKEIPTEKVENSLETPTTYSAGLDLELKLGLPINKD